MCGIIGYIGGGNAAEVVYRGLKRLEYRGYDSAGGAFVRDGRLVIAKKEGKVEKLSPLLEGLRANIGIGHTRWATHGVPSDVNAHPHSAGGIAIVHNGIIENYAELKNKLIDEGVIFRSDTDSEVIAHLLARAYNGDLTGALAETVGLLKGSYAIMAICEREHIISLACNKSPLIIGRGGDGYYCASDEPALAGYCPDVAVLQDGDIAELRADEASVFNGGMQLVIRETVPNLAVCSELGLDDYPHYMSKEISEIPAAVAQTVKVFGSVKQKIAETLGGAKRIILTGCGTAYHAALLGKIYFENMLGVPSEVETAGELRYKKNVVGESVVAFAISQSGETADTVEAARLLKSLGAKVVAVTNSLHSQLTRVADAVVPVAAGPEICVAATKSYSGQVAALYLCALAAAGTEGDGGLGGLSETIERTLERTDTRSLAQVCAHSRGVYFLGRGIDYAVAVEGSLKLKEVSYVPGEGYPSGELKHGTLALIDGQTTSVFVICDEALAEKSVVAAEQVLARGGKVAVITCFDSVRDKLEDRAEYFCRLEKVDKFLSPLLSSAVLFKLAYDAAVALGRDPDKPRNLAKSVTVE